MNKEFIQSADVIRKESMDMIKTLSAVKGENYARLVHTVIMADQIETIGNIFIDSASDDTKEVAAHLVHAQMGMVAQIIRYYTRSTQFSDKQIEDAFKDSDLVQKSAFELLQKAKDLSDSGKVIGE